MENGLCICDIRGTRPAIYPLGATVAACTRVACDSCTLWWLRLESSGYWRTGCCCHAKSQAACRGWRFLPASATDLVDDVTGRMEELRAWLSQ